MTRYLALLALIAMAGAAAYGGIRLYSWAHDSNSQYRSSIAAGMADSAKFQSAPPEEQRRMLAGKNTAYMAGLGMKDQYRLRVFSDVAGNYWILGPLTTPSNDVPIIQVGPVR